MKGSHPYVRAYLAGIAAPTLFLLVGITGLAVARGAFDQPPAVERVIVFPMAVVPNLWGAWNMLYCRLQSGRWLPIGVHGAILPLLLLPAGYALAGVLEVHWIPPGMAALGLPVVMAVYYLAWKYIVSFLNELLGVA